MRNNIKNGSGQGFGSICAIWWMVICLTGLSSATFAENSASQFIEFDDEPLAQDLILPDWFKLSFLELKNDVADIRESNKNGLIVYFGQKDCAYCKMHLEKNWGDRGIVNYTQKHFEVVAIDVRGQRPVADVSGKIFTTEKEFSAVQNTHFTPSLLFYDTQGKEVLRLSGYHPPYQFRATLEYIADEHYKRENLREYLARGETLTGFDESDLNDNDVFTMPPFALDRSRFSSNLPLVVFFEEPTCHACNVLHSGPLMDEVILKRLGQLEAIQLDMKSDTPVITPAGDKTTAEKWAKQLELYYAPTIVFFDSQGKEILRIDSVVRFYRLKNVLYYVLNKEYVDQPNFQLWRQQNNR